MADSDLDVIYHGYLQQAGGSSIVIEAADGSEIGLVAHVARHSPTGMSWGYRGSGASDCARSILITALGDEARCRSCNGTHRIVWPTFDESPRPFNAETDAEDSSESCFDCDGGYRQLPYHQFKDEFVVGWGDEWRMSRRAVLEWLGAWGVDVAAVLA